MEKLTPKHLEIMRQALVTNGEDAQWRMVQEEFAECIAAINQAKRGRVTVHKIAEEVADAYIMVEQARQLLGPAIVDRWVEIKMQRLADNLDVGSADAAVGAACPYCGGIVFRETAGGQQCASCGRMKDPP